MHPSFRPILLPAPVGQVPLSDARAIGGIGLIFLFLHFPVFLFSSFANFPMNPARLAELTILAARTVAAVRGDLPPNVQAVAAECPVVLLTMEAWADEQDEAPDEELLGLFLGVSRVDGPPSGPADAPQIFLFVDNLWAFCEENRECFAEEVETTFLHELGHYLGLDEDEVAHRGLA